MTTNNTYFLTSKRLGFRCWQNDDLDLACMLWGDYEVTKLFDARGKWSRAEVLERLVKEIQTEMNHGVQYWPIILLSCEEFIGCCGLRPYDLPKNIFEIGFHIRSDRWRRGYAREAGDAVIRFAFDILKVDGIFAGHNPENHVSRRLLEQLGFGYTHDDYYPPTGLNHPSYLLRAQDLPLKTTEKV